MNCNSCGFILADNAAFCPNCGASITAAAPAAGPEVQPAIDQAAPPAQQYAQSAAQPYQQAYDPNAQQYYQQTAAAQPYAAQPATTAAPAAGIKDSSTAFIVISALEFFFIGGFFALIPLAFSLQYRKACQEGRADVAEKKRKNALISLIVVPIAIIVVFALLASTGALD